MTKLRIEAGQRSGPRHDVDPDFRLDIRDDASGELLAGLTLTAGQLVRLIGGTSYLVEGAYSPNLFRVGFKQVVRQVDVPREIAPSYGRATDETVEAIQRWAREHALPGETSEYRQSNNGWKVVYRSWNERAL